MSFAAARAGIAALLDACELNVYPRLTDVVDPPAAVVQWPESIDPRNVFEGSWDYVVPVLLCVSYADPPAADINLEALLANIPGSPFYVLDNGRSLGGGAMSSAVVGITDIGTVEAQGITLFGCRVLVQVIGG